MMDGVVMRDNFPDAAGTQQQQQQQQSLPTGLFRIKKHRLHLQHTVCMKETYIVCSLTIKNVCLMLGSLVTRISIIKEASLKSNLFFSKSKIKKNSFGTCT